MSIFKRKSQENEETLVAPLFEGYDCENYGDIIAIEESYDDMLAVIEAIHELDQEEIEYTKSVSEIEADENLSEEDKTSKLEEAATSFETVTEAAGGNFFEKVKKMLENLWGKLKAFFGSVVKYFNIMVSSGKTFATKYEKELTGKDLSGFIYAMYNYTNLDNNKNVTELLSGIKEIEATDMDTSSKSVEELDETIKEIQELKTDYLNTIRGVFVGKSGGVKAEDFSKELFGYFRDGAEPGEEKPKVNVNIKDIINSLKNGSEQKMAEEARKDCDKVFSEKIKAVKSIESKIKGSKSYDKAKASKMISITQQQISMFSQNKTIALEFFRAWRQAIGERNNVYKSVCVAALSYKKSK